MSRYVPSRTYLYAAITAAVLGLFSVGVALRFWAASGPAVLFFLTSAALFYFYLRPAVEVHPTHLAIGSERFGWNQIRQVDHTGWFAPLVLYLTIQDGRRVTLQYPGDLESATFLLREIRQMARLALIDGVPHREYWRQEESAAEIEAPASATAANSGGRQQSRNRYPILPPGEEEEIERMFQRLKTVGHMDHPKDEK